MAGLDSPVGALLLRTPWSAGLDMADRMAPTVEMAAKSFPGSPAWRLPLEVRRMGRGLALLDPWARDPRDRMRPMWASGRAKATLTLTAHHDRPAHAR